MFRSGNWRLPVAIGAASAVLVGAATVGLTGIAERVEGASRRGQRGGVIKFAEMPAGSPNYIFPETSTANQSLYNIDQFINLMWPFIYLPTPDEPTLDYAHSMANPPVWIGHTTPR